MALLSLVGGVTEHHVAFAFGCVCLGPVISGKLNPSGLLGSDTVLCLTHAGLHSLSALVLATAMLWLGPQRPGPNYKAPSSPFPSQAMSVGCSRPTGQTFSNACSVRTCPALSPLGSLCAVLNRV